MRAAISKEIAAFILVLNYGKSRIFDQFMKAVSRRIDLPDNLIAQLKSTIIHVKFVVNKDGRLSDFKYDSDIPFEIKREITAAILGVGPWKPGRLQGEPVAINYTIPIRL